METLSSSKLQSWLSWFLRGLLILGFLVLLGRLIDLQVIRGAYYKNLAEDNRVRRVSIQAQRGKILARGGGSLVGNKEVKKRIVFDPKEGYDKVADIAGAGEEEIITEWVRDYILGADFAHAGGYVGEVGASELGKVRAECPDKGPRRLGAIVGRTGLEEEYDCRLSGIDGEELVEVNSLGERVRNLGRREPVKGEDVKTSINLELQKKTAQAMGENKGAVIVTDAKGEILSLYSSPSFNPNKFVRRNTEDEVLGILQDSDKPLFNRAIGGTFHPGSVFKPVVAIAALEEDEIDGSFVYEDKGEITVETLYGTFTYSNWYFTQYGGVEGKIRLPKAIARSTDTFFYKLGEFLGPETMAKWASTFHLDEKTGIDLPGEVAGLVPTPEWKMNTIGERWFLGNTYHMAIGQGDMALTPIGINASISAIAADGVYCTPRIVGEPECQNLGISAESISLVKEGMVGACDEEGTAFPFFDFEEDSGIQVACKTGTAETGFADESTHAWFSVFAPVDEPEIVATVLVERGGEGSRVAAPIAREIFDYWFGVEESTQNEQIETD